MPARYRGRHAKMLAKMAKLNANGNGAGSVLKRPKASGVERVPSEPTVASAGSAPPTQPEPVGRWINDADGHLNVGQAEEGSGWAQAYADDGAGPADDTAGLDDVDLLSSIEYLLTGPYSAFLHTAIVGLAISLYVKPKVSPRVWSEGVEMRPGTWLQEFMWHVADELQAIGFEATITAGLAAAVVTLLFALWLRVRDYGLSSGDSDSDSDTRSTNVDGEAVSTGSGSETNGDGRVSVEVGVDEYVEGDADDDEPPYLLGMLVFVAVMALVLRSPYSPLNYTPPPLVIHSNVVAENQRILDAIANLERLAAEAMNSSQALTRR